MEDITKQEYSAWLEEALGTLLEIHPTSLCAVAMAEDGTTFTSYYNAGPSYKAVFANHIQSDIVMDIIKGNAEKIKEILDGDSDEKLQ